MTLALALNNALSGLRLNQQSISVLSNNVANVNTPGYSRQIVNQSALVVSSQGSGVQIDEITRKIDKYLQRAVQTQGSSYASSQSLDDYYQRLQAVLGKPGASNSIDTSLTGYFNSIQQLAESPETTSLKSNAVGSGVALAKQLSDLAANVYDLRFEADGEMGDAVTTVNNALDKLYNLNRALTQAAPLGSPVTGLLDERDAAINTLSQYINIAVSYSETGSASVVGGNGVVLLEDGVRHKLQYVKATSMNSLVQDAPLNAVEVATINDEGKQVGKSALLITGGKSADIKANLTGGKIAALQQIRDVKFPAILEQLDQLVAKLRDNVDAIHNNGSGFPPATSLTGNRAISAVDQYSWSGSVRIAVLRADGTPVPSSYSDESYTGVRPLLLDFTSLNSGQGNGKPTMQTIVDEINNHFGAPANKAKLGNLNNIQLASDTKQLPSGAISLFNFDLDMENISADPAQVFVTGMSVLDDTGTNITSVTQTAPSITLQATSSFITTVGSADVTITLSSIPTMAVGDKIYLNAPSVASVNGITPAQLTGFFTVASIVGNQVTFTSGGVATASGPVNDPGSIQMMPPYDHVGAGQQQRSANKGQMQVDFSANIASTYYDVTMNVSVIGADGVVHTAPITYRLTNNDNDMFNKRYSTTAVGAPGTLVLPLSSQSTMRAILVDAKGNEIPKINGNYQDVPAYLKLIGGTDGITPYSVAIDERDSQQLGRPDDSPAQAGTNWGFSHYFGLNNFFDANAPTSTGDSLRNSAYNLKVQDRLMTNADLLSTGTLTKQEKGISTNNNEVYTYARYSGDNTIAQQMAQLNTNLVGFDAAGGLPATQLSLHSYTGEVIGYIAQRSAEATDNAANSKTLYDGFKNKSDAISGVNLDQELANTVVLQNAYSASARVITIVNKMYDDLMQTL